MDEALRAGDESRWQALQTLMRRVSSLNAKLMSMKVAQSWVGDIDSQLDALLVRASTTPGMDFSKGIAGLTDAHSQLTTVFRESSIPANHQLRKMAKDINSRILDLTATEKVVATPGGDDKFRSGGKPAILEAYKMLRIDLPKFDGTLGKWNRFWIEFAEAVHNNVTLTQTQKLRYLLPESKDPGVYEELVKMLKRRYDKPRKLHQMHCKTLAELPVCRNNAEELLAGGDRLHKVVAGLVSLGQIDIYSIATSLGVATLPPSLQSEWETLTKEQKGVPHVDQLVSFMRERSDAVCTLDKKGEPASLPKVQKGGGARPPPTHKPKVSVHVVDSAPQEEQSLPAGSGKAKGKGFHKQLGKGPSDVVGTVAPQVASPVQGPTTYAKHPCPVCGGDHPAYFCSVFLAKSMGQGQELVTELRLCRNCLRVVPLAGLNTGVGPARADTTLCFTTLIPTTLR